MTSGTNETAITPSEDLNNMEEEEEEEFTGITAESNNSQTLDDVVDPKPIDINNALAALLESNRLMQAKLSQRETKRRKVYVPMPEKFNGRVGDFIEAWLEQFKTWFHHRALVEGASVEEREQVETAIGNTELNTCLALQNQEADFGKWMTWKEFSDYMKDTYGSSESGYTRYMRLSVMAQGKDSVTVYYARFRRMHGKQKQRMKDPLDNHVYYYMFIAGLDKRINAEVLRFPESLKIDTMEFHEVLELAKRAEQTVRSQMDFVKSSNAEPNHSKKAKPK